MRDLISEYLLTFIEIFAGIAILLLLSKFVPQFMATIN